MMKIKQRPSKLTKDDRKNAALESACQTFRSSRPEYESFLDEMIQWFGRHQEQVEERLSLDVTDRSESISPEDFELGLTDLGLPCQQFQLRMLAQLLRTGNNRMINYRDLSRQLQGLRQSERSEPDTQLSEEDIHKGGGDVQAEGAFCLEVTKEDLQRCPRCQLKLWSPKQPDKDRFIRLSVRLVPFDSAGAHPANFEVVLPSSSRVFSLIRMIQDRLGIQTSRLELFRSSVPTEDTHLPPESSLEECGFTGGPKEIAPQATVFYDYRLEFPDCPLLNCDHYFGPKHAPVGHSNYIL